MPRSWLTHHGQKISRAAIADRQIFVLQLRQTTTKLLQDDHEEASDIFELLHLPQILSLGSAPRISNSIHLAISLKWAGH